MAVYPNRRITLSRDQPDSHPAATLPVLLSSERLGRHLTLLAHHLPKIREAVGSRINLTFRRIVGCDDSACSAESPSAILVPVVSS